jgi:alpha-tubulin suppressor-like RCC1 family protein
VSRTFCSFPELVTFPTSEGTAGAEPVVIATAAAGLEHTIFLAIDGVMWGCGSTAHGALAVSEGHKGGQAVQDLAHHAARGRYPVGVFPGLETVEETRYSIPAPVKLNLFPSEFFVVGVACGLCSSFAISDAGALFFWG